MNQMTPLDRLVCRACREQSALMPFSMAFQPIIDLGTETVYAHEALVRGPQGEPARSVLDQLNDQNRYAFDQACRVEAITLAAQLGMKGRLNINFLPNAIYDPRACIRRTLDTAASCGFPPDRITFEIIESEQPAEEKHLLAIIAEYRKQGFRVALDDFGAGYSGLSRLARLRPDIIKLDRDLIAGCDRQPTLRAIIHAIARLCEQIGVELVAEGIETAAELEIVRDAGIASAQGYYLGRPAFQRLTEQPAGLGQAPAG